MKDPINYDKGNEHSLEIETFYHIIAEPGKDPWSFSLHRHENLLEISLITAGKAEFECDRVRYTLKPGDLIIKNAGVLHSEISSPEDGFEQYCLGFSGVSEPGLPPNCLVPEGISPVIHTGKAFDYLRSMTAYLYDVRSDSAAASAELIRQTTENGYSLIKLMVTNTVENSGKAAHSPLIYEVLDYIDSNVSETMSLKTLAGHFFVSTYYLAHRFKEETGQTVNQYILNCKLGKAQKSLVFSDKPIKQIAIDCGYSNLQYFYSVFKKHTGYTPAEMRHYYNHILSSGKANL